MKDDFINETIFKMWRMLQLKLTGITEYTDLGVIFSGNCLTVMADKFKFRLHFCQRLVGDERKRGQR